jgi:triphosphatase
MLQMFAFAHGGAQPGGSALSADRATLIALVRPRLERMHRRLKKDAAAFLSLDDAMRHRTRRRLKRLRYSVEFVASLYRPKAVRRYQARLQAAQDVLGQNNDLAVAEAAFRRQLEKDARAWFAIGYLAARRPQLLQKAARAFESLAKAPSFW